MQGRGSVDPHVTGNRHLGRPLYRPVLGQLLPVYRTIVNHGLHFHTQIRDAVGKLPELYPTDQGSAKIIIKECSRPLAG